MIGAQRKITSSHLERLAVVYLRQSTAAQVRLNVRSTERQYAIAGEAARLGWESERIVVVDGDLGVSGRDTHARESYKELVAKVCLGEVGAIFGLEVSRLARNNADLLRLLEFCALTDTLVLDTDGIYDLQDFNDRLLLGLKAQMSEAELHIITARLQGAKRAAAERGELRFPLAVGYVYDEQGDWIIDPDEEVQAAIRDLFKAFEQTGSAYRVVGVFKGRRFPKRNYGGAWAGETALAGAPGQAAMPIDPMGMISLLNFTPLPRGADLPLAVLTVEGPIVRNGKRQPPSYVLTYIDRQPVTGRPIGRREIYFEWTGPEREDFRKPYKIVFISPDGRRMMSAALKVKAANYQVEGFRLPETIRVARVQ